MNVQWVSGASRERPTTDGRAGLRAKQGLRSEKFMPPNGRK
ncbi:MAG: hypothetical protein WD823_14095 [Sulfuricaulis sp.]